MESSESFSSDIILPDRLEPDIAEAYEYAAKRSLLKALNPKVFFGYFSVTADGKGHGWNTTFPGLDWGQSAEALLYLGRTAEVLASWEYVKKFQKPKEAGGQEGLFPFAIIPDNAGQTVGEPQYPLTVEANGGVYRHWVPGNPLYVLANVTVIQLAEAIYRHLGDRKWLEAQQTTLRKAADWLVRQIQPNGLVPGGGFYIERPTRLDYDGVAQCYVIHALRLSAELLNDPAYKAAADRMVESFRKHFWAGDHCVEYIHPEHGAISHHGLTDVDWAAIAMDVLTPQQEEILWPQLKDNPDFLYNGMPTGIATKPETYEDWEMQNIDRHDLAAMGRVWYLEAWARFKMQDREGLIESMKKVIDIGKANKEGGWSWVERYYSEKTGNLGKYHIEWYCEYPANLIRIVHRFL